MSGKKPYERTRVEVPAVADGRSLPRALGDGVLGEHLEAVATSNLAGLVDVHRDGIRLKPGLSASAMSVIAELRLDDEGRVRSLKLHNKLTALRMLMEAAGMFQPHQRQAAVRTVNINLAGAPDPPVAVTDEGDG